MEQESEQLKEWLADAMKVPEEDVEASLWRNRGANLQKIVKQLS